MVEANELLLNLPSWPSKGYRPVTIFKMLTRQSNQVCPVSILNNMTRRYPLDGRVGKFLHLSCFCTAMSAHTHSSCAWLSSATWLQLLSYKAVFQHSLCLTRMMCYPQKLPQLHLLRCKHRLTNIQHRANTVLLNPTILPSKGYWPVSIVNSMTPSAVQDADGAVRFDGQNGNPSSNALLYLHLYATASTADSLLVSATEEMQKTLWEVQAAHKHMWLSSTAVKGCCW